MARLIKRGQRLAPLAIGTAVYLLGSSTVVPHWQTIAASITAAVICYLYPLCFPAR